MWSDKLRLVFTTELSLIDNVKCLQYYFWSCAMDKAEGYTYCANAGPPNGSYKTQSEDMFIPHACT